MARPASSPDVAKLVRAGQRWPTLASAGRTSGLTQAARLVSGWPKLEGLAHPGRLASAGSSWQGKLAELNLAGLAQAGQACPQKQKSGPLN